LKRGQDSLKRKRFEKGSGLIEEEKRARIIGVAAAF
jgi:hypothetical protein